MNQLGIGTMIHYLYGGSEHEAKEYIGKKIKNINFVSDTDDKESAVKQFIMNGLSDKTIFRQLLL